VQRECGPNNLSFRSRVSFVRLSRALLPRGGSLGNRELVRKSHLEFGYWN